VEYQESSELLRDRAPGTDKKLYELHPVGELICGERGGLKSLGFAKVGNNGVDFGDSTSGTSSSTLQPCACEVSIVIEACLLKDGEEDDERVGRGGEASSVR
jgi:hypothetical protein